MYRVCRSEAERVSIRILVCLLNAYLYLLFAPSAAYSSSLEYVKSNGIPQSISYLIDQRETYGISHTILSKNEKSTSESISPSSCNVHPHLSKIQEKM